MSAVDETRKGKVVGDLPVFLLLPAIEDVLHPLAGLARDKRLIVPVVGSAGMVELARVNALPQGLVQGGHRDLVPR